MGIPGLTTFISNYSEHFLVNYKLHDTYLVIDGATLVSHLYDASCNNAFGVDYGKFAQCVSEFFDELLKCNVTPLVLFDGATEDKKLKTKIIRTSKKIRLTSCYTYGTPSVQQQKKLFTPYKKKIFQEVMEEKGIRYAKCIFEADDTIVAIARILKCPILSYDSDFYISGSLYIPINTLQNDIVRNSADNGYMKHCKVYHVENLFHFYNGLNQSLLPLASVLLGNDYVEQRTFNNFFRHLKLPPAERKMFNERLRRIDATFNWLRRYSLSQAIIEILSRLPKEKRQYVLNIIETMINNYTDVPLSLLAILGIPAEKFSEKHVQDTSKPYKFEGDIDKLIYIEEEAYETNISDTEEIDEQQASNILEKIGLVSNESLINNLPEWFIKEFMMDRYPSYFINLIIRKLYIFTAGIEDYTCRSSGIASLQILNVIYRLLMSGIDKEKTSMKFIARGENVRIKYDCLEYNDDMFGDKLPSLSNLRKIPITIRKEILNTTLGVTSQNCMNDFPSAWMLYVATMKYWIDQQQEQPKLMYHIYSLLLAMLYNIIDLNVGVYRNLDTFQQKFDETIQNIQSARKIKNYRLEYSMNLTILDAIYAVSADDCLIAAPFFISNFEIDDELYSQPEKVNVTIVHSLTEFQHCLKFSMDLNALLGCPYRPMKILKLYSGVLLYNLCNNFKRHENVEAYINSVLHNSPSLERLFNILLLKFKSLSSKWAMQVNVSKYEKQNPEYEKKQESAQENHLEKSA
ncbi:PREDICTED: protein asteroid-like isoform X1 [Dinoponera quadriceps]|uniref:Protein asteroid-like isoform X1 n=1 Tax=Dinoponera quadriceps TaxID=609295 RepID=A0A6P3XJ05_DINQU|nr:PREDICTED: protein asteroid-like isoform X1 [Dinoponera quadriceps]XP_014478449.1 PREDICTED: protein asteroid-like isoform X1 [Dinoponera quadriceps]XP_014478450.1 PREDICTED: protein asteroid-like isoform X1 [Dinoponera quadriceps]XP_014478451.1 PREDICTED: protein asteroid-like isoform X1 [Dinoponera quadriceps]